jgi:hypothetical protein
MRIPLATGPNHWFSPPSAVNAPALSMGDLQQPIRPELGVGFQDIGAVFL